MTIGERIHKYRKELNLSQEELGKKLLVSRQTISLWEKDQTVPTIDNLIRLREIFGVSVDDILGFEHAEKKDEILPRESYRVVFSKEELNEIYRMQKRDFYKKPTWFVLLCAFFIVLFISSGVYGIETGFFIGMLCVGLIPCVKGVRAYNKACKKNMERIPGQVYGYNIFEKHISINIYRENEKVRESKYSFEDIEQIRQLGNWIFLQISGQAFVLRKSDLKENSVLYSYMYKNPSKTVNELVPGKWRVTSILLFVASLLSILGAIVLVGAVSGVNGLFVENMWIFYAMTPVPIASIIFGFILKSKGYKYVKNIVVGFIMTFFLCVYGSFVFMF